MERYDLIVLGAGPAGSAAAMRGIELGLTVALIDRARFPRHKLCGGLLTKRSQDRIDRLFGGLPAAQTLSKTSVAFFFEGRPAGAVEDAPAMDLAMRWEMDALLAERALAAGAADFTGQKVTEIDPEARCLRIGDQTYGYGVLVGADGVNSQVARQLFGAAIDHRQTGFGLEVEAKGGYVDPSAEIQIDLGAARWGYGWSFPKRHSTTIGVFGLMSENPDIKERFWSYLNELDVEAAPKEAKGQFIPFGCVRKVPGQGAILLAGDAAGLVDPITGEGIALALESGERAAESAAKALAEGQPDRAIELYRVALRPIHRSLRMAIAIRPLLFKTSYAGFFEKAFRRSKTLKQEYMRLLAGEKDYDDILRALLWRAPRIAFGLVQNRLTRS